MHGDVSCREVTSNAPYTCLAFSHSPLLPSPATLTLLQDSALTSSGVVFSLPTASNGGGRVRRRDCERDGADSGEEYSCWHCNCNGDDKDKWDRYYGRDCSAVCGRCVWVGFRCVGFGGLEIACSGGFACRGLYGWVDGVTEIVDMGLVGWPKLMWCCLRTRKFSL